MIPATTSAMTHCLCRSVRALGRTLGPLAIAIAAVATAVPTLSQAAEWPARPIKIVIPFAPGGAADAALRVIAPELQTRLGQPVVVENRAGAGATIGTAAVAGAPADGYTLLMGSAANAIDNAIQKKLPYVFERDLTPVLLVAEVPGVVVVPRALPVHTVQELIAYAKSQPAGSLNYGSPGYGTSVHLAGELFESMTGVTLQHIPYKGAAPAITDLLGSRLQMMFPALAAAQPHIQSGALRALAVTPKTRTALAPNLPTVQEAGLPGFEVGGWIGLFAPAGVPQPVQAKLQRALEDVLRQETVRSSLARIGIEAIPASAQALRERVEGDTRRWTHLIKTQKIEQQ